MELWPQRFAVDDVKSAEVGVGEGTAEGELRSRRTFWVRRVGWGLEVRRKLDLGPRRGGHLVHG